MSPLGVFKSISAMVNCNFWPFPLLCQSLNFKVPRRASCTLWWPKLANYSKSRENSINYSKLLWNAAGKVDTSKSPVLTFCQLLPPECALGLTMDLNIVAPNMDCVTHKQICASVDKKEI